jgi:integrase
MLKRDPYDHENRWEKWKQENSKAIKGISTHNSDLIMSFLTDMEIGKNVAPVSKKGERGYSRLLALKSRLMFFATRFADKNLDAITKDDIHQLFFDMRKGKITKINGECYRGVGNFVKDFKSFWGWLIRTDRVKENITVDLRRSDGRKPDWVYLTEEQFKSLANHANADYRALIWFMYDTGARVTEAYSIRVKDFSNDFTKLNIRKEYSKTFGRIVNLKLCCGLIKGYIQLHNLQSEDFLFIKKPAAFNKYLRTTTGRIFGDKESPARESYNKMTLYDIRHNACCYWLRRYPTTTALMYRMGWSEEKEVRYYSEFLGLADQIDDDDMVTAEDKSRYEKRILALEKDHEKANELVKKLIEKISELQGEMGDRQLCRFE